MVKGTENENNDSGYTFLSMEDEAYLQYDVPKSSPHILVNQLGYLKGKTKTAYFYAEELPKAFNVIDEKSGLVVYTGKLEEKGYNETYKANIAVGNFTDFDDEGEYYIKADYLGTSYKFGIGDGLYDDVFKEACKTYYYNRCGMTLTENFAGDYAHNACHTSYSVLRDDMTVNLDVTGGWHQDASGSKNVKEASKVLANILLSYEIFPGAFSDDNGIPESRNDIPDILDEVKYEIEWLKKMQNESTGAVYSAVTVTEGTNKTLTSYVENADIASTYAYAFSLAKFSFIYQTFDKPYATECLKSADRAWKYASLNEDDNEENALWKLLAAAELYRASGQKEFEDYLLKFWEDGRFEDYINDEITFYGCVTYLNTKQKTDREVCNGLIKAIMKKAEKISANARKAPFATPADTDQTNNASLMDQMIVLTLVDYIITNHEYDNIIENYINYFMGRNPMSISYIDDVGTYNYMEVHPSLGLMKQFDQNSKLIFMMSRIVEN